MARLGRHPNLVAYHGSWLEGTTLFIQMELCVGTLDKDHRQRVVPQQQQEVDVEVAVATATHVYQDIASALRHMHDKGIAHLDVKPENIFRGSDGRWKLGDLGNVVIVPRTDSSKDDHHHHGTPNSWAMEVMEGDGKYLAPELLRGDHRNLERCDMWSLGMTLLQILRGSLPSVDDLRPDNLDVLLTEMIMHHLSARSKKTGMNPHDEHQVLLVAWKKLLSTLLDPDPLARTLPAWEMLIAGEASQEMTGEGMGSGARAGVVDTPSNPKNIIPTTTNNNNNFDSPVPAQTITGGLAVSTSSRGKITSFFAVKTGGGGNSTPSSGSPMPNMAQYGDVETVTPTFAGVAGPHIPRGYKGIKNLNEANEIRTTTAMATTTTTKTPATLPNGVKGSDMEPADGVTTPTTTTPLSPLTARMLMEDDEKEGGLMRTDRQPVVSPSSGSALGGQWAPALKAGDGDVGMATLMTPGPAQDYQGEKIRKTAAASPADMEDSPALELTPSMSTGMKPGGEGKQAGRSRRWAFSSPIAHGQMLLKLTVDGDQDMEGGDNAHMD